MHKEIERAVLRITQAMEKIENAMQKQREVMQIPVMTDI